MTDRAERAVAALRAIVAECLASPVPAHERAERACQGLTSAELADVATCLMGACPWRTRAERADAIVQWADNVHASASRAAEIQSYR